MMLFGIGIDAQSLAATMGFPTDPAHAQTVAASARGIHQSVISMTQTTVGGAWKRRSSNN